MSYLIMACKPGRVFRTQAASVEAAAMAARCGETRSGMVEKLVRETEMPRPRTGYAKRETESK